MSKQFFSVINFVAPITTLAIIWPLFLKFSSNKFAEVSKTIISKGRLGRTLGVNRQNLKKAEILVINTF